MTLADAFQRKYDMGNHKYQVITRKLAVFIGSSNVPNSLVENEEFKLLIEALDPQYQVPGRSRIYIGKEIVTDLKRIFNFTSLMHVKSDTWTKRGMSSSYTLVLLPIFSPSMIKEGIELPWLSVRCLILIVCKTSEIH